MKHKSDLFLYGIHTQFAKTKNLWDKTRFKVIRLKEGYRYASDIRGLQNTVNNFTIGLLELLPEYVFILVAKGN